MPERTPISASTKAHVADAVSFHPDRGADDLTSPVLGSWVNTHVDDPRTIIEAGSLTLTPGSDGERHSFLPTGSVGRALRGLPVIGIEATRDTNGNVIRLAPALIIDEATLEQGAATVVDTLARLGP